MNAELVPCLKLVNIVLLVKTKVINNLMLKIFTVAHYFKKILETVVK